MAADSKKLFDELKESSASVEKGFEFAKQAMTLGGLAVKQKTDGLLGVIEEVKTLIEENNQLASALGNEMTQVLTKFAHGQATLDEKYRVIVARITKDITPPKQ